ncbi:unnamed protein product [Phytophthora fragariaefolia]|uniref:Unnamed protein product n=1 Tax=Phytophthora fragariaefolia TaxID=1490495 RepID=A0A9W6XKZ5_9STRA|nr:unnamed protein product [Phytophthora fragariaefolia]
MLYAAVELKLTQGGHDGREGLKNIDHLCRKAPPEASLSDVKKVYPVSSEKSAALDEKSSTSAKDDVPSTSAARQLSKSILLRGLIAIAAAACLGWTLWFIFLNIAPNDTVNLVMNTESFDYGSFWLMVDPPQALIVLSTFGLLVVAAGYLAVVIKIVMWRREGKQPCLVQRSTSKDLLTKVKKALSEAVNDRTNSRVGSSAIRIVASLTRAESPARKFIVRCTRTVFTL